ncbi:hypothetical protein [Thioalbus denitrificans]|uniref:Uncharacterized protein n=1 Tax=Thioalbus denitrificans TaxID=547122 RepID=A0A369CDJ0_9GAMM|nr:hypothetical protein [Thioalbus denitrificans]RCX32070.1 hypothetical protein DFQ59_102423 [Thioalbus denitrificans]
MDLIKQKEVILRELEQENEQLHRRLEIAEAQAAQFRRLRDAVGLEWVVDPERLAALVREAGRR